jgi:hypothetical protein
MSSRIQVLGINLLEFYKYIFLDIFKYSMWQNFELEIMFKV